MCNSLCKDNQKIINLLELKGKVQKFALDVEGKAAEHRFLREIITAGKISFIFRRIQ